MQKTTTMLMFVGRQFGKAEEAMKFYTSLFPDSKILQVERYQKGEHDKEGMIKHARFTLNGLEYMAMESSFDHKFTFTPAMSIFITCESEAEIDELYKKLSEGGKVLMELMNYGFSKKFGWVDDKYGVSWQMNWM